MISVSSDLSLQESHFSKHLYPPWVRRWGGGVNPVSWHPRHCPHLLPLPQLSQQTPYWLKRGFQRKWVIRTSLLPSSDCMVALQWFGLLPFKCCSPWPFKSGSWERVLEISTCLCLIMFLLLFLHWLELDSLLLFGTSLIKPQVE